MKTIFSNFKTAAAATAGVVLLMMLFATGLFYINNKTLTKNLNDEKLKTEMILSEKLALQKDLENFKLQINSLNGKNQDLDNYLSETRQKLIVKENEVKKMIRENGNIKTLKKQIAELNRMKKDFENQVQALNYDIQTLKTNKDAIIAGLWEENKELTDNISILSAMTADNYLVETTKRKDKLTVKSKRAKKMTVNFKVPENTVESITFKLTKPDGTKVEGKDKSISYQVVNDDSRLTASIAPGDEIKVSKKIAMTYLPKEKLKPGIYKIEVFNGAKYMGTCNVKLR